jgi:hypothetical protein
VSTASLLRLFICTLCVLCGIAAMAGGVYLGADLGSATFWVGGSCYRTGKPRSWPARVCAYAGAILLLAGGFSLATFGFFGGPL